MMRTQTNVKISFMEDALATLTTLKPEMNVKKRV
ncbi:unnamed protein product [Larinioides sclopetarius]